MNDTATFKTVTTPAYAERYAQIARSRFLTRARVRAEVGFWRKASRDVYADQAIEWTLQAPLPWYYLDSGDTTLVIDRQNSHILARLPR